MDANDLIRWISDVIVYPLMSGAFALFGLFVIIGMAYAAICGRDAKPDKFVGPMFKFASGFAKVGGGTSRRPSSKRKPGGTGRSRRRN